MNLANTGTEPVFVRAAFLYVILGGGSLRKKLAHVLRYRGHWMRSQRVSVPIPEGTQFSTPLPATIDPGRALVVWIPADAFWNAVQGPWATGALFAVQDELDRTLVSGRLADAPRALPPLVQA